MGSIIKNLGITAIILGIIGSIIGAFSFGGAAGVGYFIGGVVISVITGILYIGVGEAIEDSRTAVEYLNLMKNVKGNDEMKKLVAEVNSKLDSVNAKLTMLNADINTIKINGNSSDSNNNLSVSTPTKEFVNNHELRSQVISDMVKKLEGNTSDAVESDENTTEMWKCPKCGNFNFANSKECMNCHSQNPAEKTIAMPKIAETGKAKNSQEPQMWKCPKCGNFNFANSNECMNCHTKINF